MPIYIVDEEIYDVPEVKASAFERKYPNAKVSYQDGGKIYHLPLSMREGFAKKHPNAVLEKEKELFTRDQASNSPMKPEIASPYSATPADYTQPTEAQRNFEERGNFEPIGQSSVELDGQDVPVLVGAQGQFRVPSPVKLDEQQEIFRHGNPSQEEVREEQSRAYRETMQGNYAKMDEIDKSISERMGELTSRYFKEYGGTAQSDAMGEPAYMNALKSNKDYINLRAAYNLIEDARKRDRQVRRVDDGFFVNTGRAAFETAADARTWDFGAMELSDAMSLYEAVQKDERGEKLTDSERLLLDAFESNSLAMVQNKHGKQSAGELAGATTVEMIPFIAQIIANPLAKVGTAASKGAAKAVSKWLYKRIGDVASKAARKAVYTGARGAASVAVGVPADLVGGAGVAVTSNAMKTGADVYDRLLNGDSTGEAVAKGIMSQGIEFASENAGRFIAPFFGGLGKVLGRGAELGLNKIGAGKMVNLAKDYAKKAYSPAVKEFMDNTQWSGFFGEYGEEIIGGLENAALVGDMSASEVFSKDNLFDTAVGLSVSSVLFPAVGTANYIGTKYEQRKAAEEAEKRARAVFGDKWPTFRAAIVGAKNSDELGKAVSRIYQQEGKQVADSKEVKALYEYASKYYAYNALKGINPEKVAYMSDEYKAVVDNITAGETMTPEELQVASMEAGRAMEELARLTGVSFEELSGIGVEDALNRADEAEVNGDMELAGLWRSYIQSAANLSGNERAVKNQIEQQSAASDAEVDALSNNGMIVSATLRGGENVNIVGGNIVLNADGSINEEASDKQLIVVQDGERKTIGIASIGSVDGSVAVDEEKVRRRAAIEEEARRQQMIDRGDVHVFTPGETFSTPMGEVQFVEDNGDGTASVVVNGANTVVSMEGLNNLYSQTKQAEYNASKRAEGEKGLNGEKGSEGDGQQPNVVQEPVLSPAEQRKQKRAEVAKRIPMEGKKRLWTKAKPEDVAEYISLLESDPAKQAAMVDGYLAEIAEKQAKLSPIEAAELNEDVEFWNGVKGLLGAQTENVARENNVVSKTDGVEAEVDEPTESVSAPAVEVQPANEMQPAEEQSGEANEMVEEAAAESDISEDNIMLSEEEAENLIAQMKYTAESARELELTPEAWEEEFGEEGVMESPIGAVKMGENQYFKLLKKKRAGYFGMIKPTLTNPDVVLEEYDPKDGAERQTKYLFVKTFVKADGSRYVHFESVTVLKETLEVSISSHEVSEDALKRKMQQCKLLHLNSKFLNSEGRLIEPLEEGSDLVPTPNSVSSESKDTPQVSNEQENEQKSGEIGNTGVNESVPDNEEIGSASQVENTALEQIKAELGVLNADNAAEYARRLYAVNPWSSLEEANAVLKELMKSYGQTLNGQSLGILPFLDEAKRLMAQESSEKDIVDELRERNENAKEREQRAGFPPRPSDYVDAISKEDATAAKEWEDKFNAYLQKLGVADLLDIDGTISNMQGLKKSIKAGNPKGYKENPNYKAFDYIEKALKKRRKQIESAADSAGGAEAESATGGEVGGTATISQESEQVSDQVAGPVNMETLQLNMSKEDFNALLNSGDKAAISEYLAELDNALRIDESSPFAGQMALREEYNSAVQQYGKENIPAEVMADLEKRMKPYSDLGRAIYDRKYALQDKLREIETSAEKATAAKEKEIKVENKNTAFGGFLADKTDLGASTAEKALNKKYNFDGKVMTVAEFVENAVANGNAKLSTIEEPKYKGASRAAWNRMDAKQQEEDAKKVKESGTKTVYTVNDHDLGKTAYDYAKFLLDKKVEQEKVAEKEKESERVERIEDVGEKIGGAKKDKLRETIDRMKADMEQSDETLIDKIAKLPTSKIFNFDFQKLREGGMPNEAISFMEIVKESIPAKPRTSHKVRRWVNNTLALYKLCLEVGTNWDRVNTILTSRDFAGTDLKAQFDAYMSVGGFDSGLNIGNAKLKQLDKTAGYYKDGKFISSEGKWYVRDAGKHGGIYDTKEEAVEALKAFAGDNAGTTESGKKKEVKFAVYQRREDKSIFIAIKGKSDIVIQDGFKSAKEAFDYIEANNAELQSRYRNLLDKTNADFEENRERKGRDYRNGKDVTAEEFRTTFGFRGVEFGNWMTQEDRRKAINECYDALMDLAAVCKVSPKALSLNGTLGMAFGSRGGGKFSAHYEPGKVVINLTKTRGAGTLAHEWFHAIDNYFAKMGETEFGYATGGEGMLPKGIQKYGKRYYDRNSGRVITEEEYNELAKEHTVRKEMVDAWEHLMESLKESDYYKRSNAYARLHNSKYWNDPTELGARAFSVWVENELSKQDTSNDYLANNPRYVKSEVTDAQDKYMPYPFDTDADWMDEAFGNLFEVMQERETEDGNVALYQRGSLSLDTENPAFEAATKNTVEAVKKTGVEVEEATPEMVQAMNELAEMQKRTAPETAVRQNAGHSTVVSSADGAKVLKDLDSAIAEYENKPSNRQKTFIGDLSRALNLRNNGNNSNYGTFTTVNGETMELRVSDHNVSTKNMADAGKNEGISIVITHKPNKGITNDGNAHIVEFYYNTQKLQKEIGQPYVEILKSIKQALYSGEYKDNTGLAQREEVNIPDFLRTEDGTVYGWAVNGKIFLTPEGMNPNTPAHEYTHLWASMIEKNDPKLWSRIVEVMKESPTWNEVLLDEAYRDIHNNDSRMASEVLSRLSGEENYRRAMELAEREIKDADGIIEKAKKIALWGRIKQALADFWASVKGVFGFKDKAPWTEFVDMALGDLYAGVNPNAVGSPLERMFIGERGAANLDMAEEASLRLDNLNVAREMEETGKGAKAIKLATGWERGANGKWRYEVMDDFAFDMSGNVDYGKRKPESLKEYNRYKELLHKKNALAFEGEELPADELAEFKGLEVVWRGTKLHNSERLKDFIDAPELFEAYPELRNVAVKFDDLGDNVFGQYSAARNEITINSNHKEVAIKSALAHEIQHAIQYIEGFAKGGNTESVRTKAQELRRDVRPLYEMMLDTPERTIDTQLIMQKKAKRYVADLKSIKGVNEVYINKDGIITRGRGWRSYPIQWGDLSGDALKRSYAEQYAKYAKQIPYADETAQEIMKESQAIICKLANMTEDEMERFINAVNADDTLYRSDDTMYRIREEAAPKNTGIGYKVFVLKNGELYPPMVANPNGEATPVGVWLDADAAPVAGQSKTGRSQVKAGGKGTQGGSGKLAYRPGWHLGEIPYALQFNRNDENGERTLFPANFVWAEVEYANDVDYQEEAMSYGYNQNGKFQHSYAGLPRVPENGAYHYRTNPNPDTDPWIITGAMRVKRLLTPTEVDEMVKAAGREPQRRQEGAITDEQINALNAEIANDYREGDGAYTDDEVSFENDPISKVLGKPRFTRKQRREFAERKRMRDAVEQVAGALNTPIEVIESTEGLTGRRAKAKGWYEKSTGRIVVVLPNNRSVADVMQTVLHEAVAHYGLRKLFGSGFDNFIDNIYNNVDAETRKKINLLASRNGWNLKVATEEYLASLAEDANFERVNPSLWKRIKSFFLDMLAKAGVRLDFELTDDELRYILYRSYQNLKNPGKYRTIAEEAKDIAMQSELKVGNYAEDALADANVAEDDTLFRSDSELAIEDYNRRVLESGYQMQEALQDSMLALKEAQEAIVKETGKPIRDEENAYMAENALSSVNTAEAAEYKRAFYQPLVDELAKVGKKMGYMETYDYLMAKHGIERNREMSVKEALKVKGVVDKAKYDSWRSERNDMIADAKKNSLSWEETQRELDALAGNYGATIRDYSGLSSIYGDNFAEMAYGAVRDFENNVDTNALWARIKAANNATLMKLYNSSILDEETFAQISGMYEYYIPLRGFDEKIAEDVYAYVAQDTGRAGSVMKIARGRHSKAENPVAFIGQMAEQAITQGNRNRVKLRFLNFALSHMTSLLTVTKDVYLRREGDEWVVVTPKEAIDKLNNPTPDQIAEAVQKWEEDMREKVKDSPKDFKKVNASEGIPYKMPNKDLLSEHQVFVKRAGKMFVITVNGSPRLAQALNGLTNPDQGTGIKLIDTKANVINKINRALSTVYTTRNINFVASNFVRDMVYTNSMVWVKESPKYALRFHGNVAMVFPKMYSLFSKLENGTLDETNPIEKMFAEFIRNGGETGYTQIKDIEAKKKELKKILAKADRKGLSGFKGDPLGKGVDGIEAIDAWLDHVNRSVENVARFAAYMTSREMGRSVSKSIWDAKEISVNFNKKGAGGKFFEANGQTLLGSLAAAVSGTGRGTYVFWNASVQGMYNFAKNAKENPTKALGLAASVFALGVIVSMFAGDDDEYMVLPEYVRRSNICFKFPWMDKDSWVTLPLPIEYKALYGAGEYLTNICAGKEEFDALKAGELISQLLPIDVLEGGGGLNAFMPSLAKPIWEAYITNKSWTGLPVWKDSPFDTENVPQYQRVYRNTSPALVSFTKKLNQMSGGDERETGWIDINPAKLEHVLEGYLGGYATMARQITNLYSGVTGDEDYSFDPKDIPIASRVWKYGDRERGSSGVKDKFYEYKKNHEVVKAQLKGYAKDAFDPKRSEEDRKYSAERVKEIQNSDAFKAMMVFEAYRKALENAHKAVKENDTKENRQREAMLMEQVNEAIEQVLAE